MMAQTIEAFRGTFPTWRAHYNLALKHTDKEMTYKIAHLISTGHRHALLKLPQCFLNTRKHAQFPKDHQHLIETTCQLTGEIITWIKVCKNKGSQFGEN